MGVHLFGTNYQSSPLQVREQLALSPRSLDAALGELCEQLAAGRAEEGALLATCNRFEVLLVAPRAQDARACFDGFISRSFAVHPGELEPFMYFKQDGEAIEHLMVVAAGLDSMVLGETQILGQVAGAYRTARQAGATGPVLNRLFTKALQAGKQVRSETDIGRGTSSIGHAAARLAQDRLGPLDQTRALVVGAGEMATFAARALACYGPPRITCISRTYEHAREAVKDLNGAPAPWEHLPEALAEADLVISATGAQGALIDPSSFARRDRRPLLIIDLAVPRDVDPRVGQMPAVELCHLDDLVAVVHESKAGRVAALAAAQEIIAGKRAAFKAWLNSQTVVPTIVAMRRKAEGIAHDEVKRMKKNLNGAASEEIEELYKLLAHRIVQKLLHEPTRCLHERASTDDAILLSQTVWDLFGLE